MKLTSLFFPLTVVIAIFTPLVIGLILGHYLLNKISFYYDQTFIKWLLIVGLIITILFLIGIAIWSIYCDRIWEGIMNPLPYLGSIFILILSIFLIISFMSQSHLLRDGKRVITKVDNIITYLEYDHQNQIMNRVYQLTYNLPLEDGKKQKIKQTISANLGKKLHPQDDLPVIYLPQKPSSSLPVEEINPLNKGGLALGALLAIYLSFLQAWLIDFFWEKGLEKFLNKLDR